MPRGLGTTYKARNQPAGCYEHSYASREDEPAASRIGALSTSATSIEWTDATWTPLTGCTKISPGCQHCYAERMAKRLQAMGNPNYANGFKLTLHEHMLDVPLRWRKPRSVFVNSMSDLFHKDVPEEYVQRVFDVMRRAS